MKRGLTLNHCVKVGMRRREKTIRPNHSPTLPAFREASSTSPIVSTTWD